jgi:hypothetical protein
LARSAIAENRIGGLRALATATCFHEILRLRRGAVGESGQRRPDAGRPDNRENRVNSIARPA